MYEINEKVIREKVMQLMKEMGVSKKKLGEVLGSQGDHVNVRINRANRFLAGEKKKLTIGEVNRVARFFGKPATWFFYKESHEGGHSQNQNVIDKEETIREIEKGLRLLKLDEGYVNVQIQQIRAISDYGTKENL